jgi:hypothetical protein
MENDFIASEANCELVLVPSGKILNLSVTYFMSR